MKKLLVSAFVFSAGFILALLFFYAQLYTVPRFDAGAAQSLRPFLQLAGQSIAPGQQRCAGFETDPAVTVAEVLATMIDQNHNSRLNRLEYGCDDERCVMSISDCQPWQSSECGQRFLMFSRANGQAELSTLTCFDMP